MNTPRGTRLRLCIVTPAHSGAQTGGAEYQINCLIDELAATSRYEIFYLARLVDLAYVPHGYQIVQVGHTNRPPRFGYITDAVPLYRALRHLHPDVIYQRVACGHTGIAAYFARRHGARMIWHVAHDSDVMRESVIDGGNPLRRLMEKASIRYGIRHVQGIVTQTRHQAQLLAANFGRQADAVIPNFQPPPVEPVDKADSVTVLWIGSLKPWKQPEAFVRLAAACRDLQAVRFVLVGGGSDGTRWHEGLMRQIGVTDNLEYVGALSQVEVNRALARAHIYVNTSLYEGFPNTFIQAWMREVPVLSLHVDPDGVLEREQLGGCAGSEPRLAQLVRKLVVNEPLRRAMGARCRGYANQHHSMANVGRLVELIEAGN